jgi:hypothetical protein
MSQIDWVQFRESYKQASKQSYNLMKDSHMYLGMVTPEFFKDPVCMIQLGLAVLLDKPLYLLVRKNVPIPQHLRNIASAIEIVEDDSQEAYEQASRRLLDKASKDLLAAKQGKN